jgi:hypothetical protein
MFEVAEAHAIDVTEDGFTLLAGSRRVEPNEFPDVEPLGLVMPVIADALRSAAAADGSLIDFDIRAFYSKHITEAIGHGPDDPPLRYDAFTSMTLMEAFRWMEAKGFLAHRGKGDSYDYWLACPGPADGDRTN